jgi:DNA-directed RNA polymerase subunit F
MMSRIIDKICLHIAESTGLILIACFPLKGGKNMHSAIYEHPLKDSSVQLRLHLIFNDGKIESYRLGLNEQESSIKYIEFMQWDYAKFVYQDENYKLDNVKRELFKITVFEDERFRPRQIDEVIPEIRRKLELILNGEEEYIDGMKNALCNFNFPKYFYSDFSVNFLIRSILYRLSKGISIDNYDETKLIQLAKADAGQPGCILLSEFNIYQNKPINGVRAVDLTK